ncbi:MAG: DUF1801 domain-containing protein [Chitinophagales bacterium]|jgi:uncharacterized protein YdhG (YjbR/CyaY superfamily)|nr:DUF1801 domain-containing protein [Sphingobacteriales bacterium]
MASNTEQAVAEYLNGIPENQKLHFDKLRQAIKKNLDKKFEECVNYGMLGYVIPKAIYPEGYHCDPKLPLPFAGLAAQKSSINLYHMGIYVDTNLLDWFQEEYAEQCKFKLDMGKSCIRFKKYDDIPYKLIEDLFAKITVQDWITIYEKELKR